MDSRQDLGELGGWRHDEALVRTRPGDEVLYALVLKHAVVEVSQNSFVR